MVKAILAGRKTMTRRIVKPRPDDDGLHNHTKFPVSLQSDLEGWWGTVDDTGESREFNCRYGNPGDHLWVRETWFLMQTDTGYDIPGRYRYKADKDYTTHEVCKPSIHMPKEAARICLELANVKVERLHDISEEDILKEGVRVPCSDNGIMFKAGEENGAWEFMPEQWKLDRHVTNRGKEKYVHKNFDFLFAHWAELWCEINGRESWNENPWVWVVEFKVLSTTGKNNIKLNNEPTVQECDATKAS